MSDLRIEVEPVDGAGGVVLVRLLGEGRVVETDMITREFDAVAARKPRLLVVDMSGLTFAASLMMGALVKLRGQVKMSSGSMRMADLQHDVADAFRRARLDMAIPTYDTVDDALDADTP